MNAYPNYYPYNPAPYANPYAPAPVPFPFPVPVAAPSSVRNFYDYETGTDYSDSTYSSEDKSSSSHNHSHVIAPTIRIRKNRSDGSMDPRFQEIAPNFQATDTQSFPSVPVNVTVRRRTPEIEQPIIYTQPLYIVPAPIAPAPFARSILPQVQPDYRLVQPIITTTKPLSPSRTPKEKKKVRTPPASSDHYETESFPLPSAREKAELQRLRPPVRVDSKASMFESPRTRSRPIIVDEYDKPKASPPSLSYRALVKGKTTREMENDNAEQHGAPVPNTLTVGQKVTYRDRRR